MDNNPQSTSQHPALAPLQDQFNHNNNAFQAFLVQGCQQFDLLNSRILSASQTYQSLLTQPNDPSAQNENARQQPQFQQLLNEARSEVICFLTQQQELVNDLIARVNDGGSKESLKLQLQLQSQLIQSLNNEKAELTRALNEMYKTETTAANGTAVATTTATTDMQQTKTIDFPSENHSPTQQTASNHTTPQFSLPTLPKFDIQYPDHASHSTFNQLVYRNNADLVTLLEYMKECVDQIWGPNAPDDAALEDKWNAACSVFHSILNSNDCIALLETLCDGMIPCLPKTFEYFMKKYNCDSDKVCSGCYFILNANSDLAAVLLLQLFGFHSQSWHSLPEPAIYVANSPPTVSHLFTNHRTIVHRYEDSTFSTEFTTEILHIIHQCAKKSVCLSQSPNQHAMYICLLNHSIFQHEQWSSTRAAIWTALLDNLNPQRNNMWLKELKACKDNLATGINVVEFLLPYSTMSVVDELTYPEVTMSMAKSNYSQLLYSDNHQLSNLCNHLQQCGRTIWQTKATIATKFFAIRNVLVSLLLQPTYVELLAALRNDELPTDGELHHAHDVLYNKYDFWPKELNKSVIQDLIRQIHTENCNVVRCLILQLCGITYMYENSTNNPFQLQIRSFANSVSPNQFIKPAHALSGFTITADQFHRLPILGLRTMETTMLVFSQIALKGAQVALHDVNKQLQIVCKAKKAKSCQTTSKSGQ